MSPGSTGKKASAAPPKQPPKPKAKAQKKPKVEEKLKLPRNLQEALNRLPAASVSHDDVSSLCLALLGEMSTDTGMGAMAKVKAVELLLKVVQDKREADPQRESSGDILMKLLQPRSRDD